MKKSVFLTVAALVSSASLALAAPNLPQGNYSIDPYHSHITFEIPYLVIGTVDGRFNSFSSGFSVSSTGNVIATADIQIASVDTGIQKRDDHLKSPDFFDAEKFPSMTFVSKKTTWTDNSNFTLVGDLTLHGVTKPVTLKCKFAGLTTDMQKTRNAPLLPRPEASIGKTLASTKASSPKPAKS